MKRYWLFYGEQYYPIGGMEDFHGQFDTIAEAQAVFEALITGIVAERVGWPQGSPYKEYDHIKTDYWYHIFDTQEMKPVEIYPEQE